MIQRSISFQTFHRHAAAAAVACVQHQLHSELRIWFTLVTSTAWRTVMWDPCKGQVLGHWQRRINWSFWYQRDVCQLPGNMAWIGFWSRVRHARVALRYRTPSSFECDYISNSPRINASSSPQTCSCSSSILKALRHTRHNSFRTDSSCGECGPDELH